MIINTIHTANTSIEIKEGFLIKIKKLPYEFKDFLKVAHCSGKQVAIIIPEIFASIEGLGWNCYTWCEPGKKYWWVHQNEILEVKGHFSSEISYES